MSQNLTKLLFQKQNEMVNNYNINLNNGMKMVVKRANKNLECSL